MTFVQNIRYHIKKNFEMILKTVCKKKKNTSPSTNRTNATCGSGMPINQSFDPYESSLSHQVATESSAVMIAPLGMCNSSVKKMRVLKVKNTVRNGVNMKLPTSDIIDIGMPQEARIGNDVAVAIICTFRKMVR
jgi:hypothetical protein